MKRWLTAVSVVCALLPAVPTAAQDETALVSRISLLDTKKGVDAGTILVVDVRDPMSYASGRLPGAVLYTPADLGRLAAQLKASRKTIVTYCA
ncbi:MAG: rhodanese-like domain-containing protein [Vicinamibacterales bacterium]|nr:rhodanese-like domain-containing protein [Vicinamibacterales bacterium]